MDFSVCGLILFLRVWRISITEMVCRLAWNKRLSYATGLTGDAVGVELGAAVSAFAVVVSVTGA